jgi:hypothetical protein
MGSDCAPGRAGSRLVLANSKQPRPAEDGAPSRSESAASGGALRARPEIPPHWKPDSRCVSRPHPASGAREAGTLPGVWWAGWPTEPGCFKFKLT